MVALIRQADVVALVGGAPGALSAGEHVYRVDSGRPTAIPLPRALRIVAAIHDLSDSQGQIQVGAQSLIYAARGTARGEIVLVRGARLAFAEWRPFLASLILAGAGGAIARSSRFVSARAPADPPHRGAVGRDCAPRGGPRSGSMCPSRATTSSRNLRART